MNRTLHSTLLALEQRLLDPSTRRNRTAMEHLLATEFQETGKSGTRYDRAAILDRLASETPRVETALQEFRAAALGPESALVTYISVVDGARAYRSSVWIYRESRWQILHHQGTLAV